MSKIFENEGTEAVILVVASNAFNRLNRQATLLNCDANCPSPAHILVNTYRSDSYLFVDGHHLLSREGTTQGTPWPWRCMPMGHNLSFTD